MNEADARAGRPDLKDFGGAAPVENNADPAATPPVDDNPDARPVVRQDAPQPQDATPPVDDEIEEPKGPPADDARSKIFEKFDRQREAEASGDDGGPPADAANALDKQAPATPGPSADPGRITLTVLGQTITKNLDEVASLSELSREEVQSDLPRAIKYAQRELATQARLREANEFRRSAKPGPDADDGADRPARHDPNQDRSRPGHEGDSDQPAPSAQQTSGKVDYEKLVEVIQVEDPKEAGQKIREVFELVAKEASDRAISEQEQRNRRQADTGRATASMQNFVKEHPELHGNKFMAGAIAQALVDEYREDLTRALISEGEDQSEAERLVTAASPDDVAVAHKTRRMRGDTAVRQIDVPFFEKAYSRVTQSLGVKPAPQQQQNGLQARQERKRALPHQPQRASVPPASPQAQQRPPSRGDVVQEMRRARGQKA